MTVREISATAWNKLMAFLWANRIVSVRVLGSGGWKHPWHITPAWDAERSLWRMRITPGFVNGLDATVSLPAELAPEDTLARLKRAGEQPESKQSIESWLTEEPRVPLTSFRAIGMDASASSASTDADGNVSLSYEPVPEFFLAQGVVAPPDITFDASAFTESQTGTFQDSASKRLLRACDVVLYQDRIATTTQWTTGAGVDGTFAQFTVTTYKALNHRERAYLRLMPKYDPPLLATRQDQLAGDWSDTTRDEKHLATIYFVSPEGAPLGSQPDGSWTPHVRHRLWWNLLHATNQLKPPLAHANLTLTTGLAGGVGDPINNLILAQINDEHSAAAEFLGRERMEGRFWTA